MLMRRSRFSGTGEIRRVEEHRPHLPCRRHRPHHRTYHQAAPASRAQQRIDTEDSLDQLCPTQLFDILGPSARPPEIAAAVRALATNDDEIERGAIYTRSAVVDAILDLVQYVPERPLHRMRLLEPSFGGGDFLLPAIERLLQAFAGSGAPPTAARDLLRDSIRGVELHRGSYATTLALIIERLVAHGLTNQDAAELASDWLICDDFLLVHFPGRFDFVVGNPPYVRQERIPKELLAEYRRRFSTLYDRADLYVPFFERSLDLLRGGGAHGFICANRWLKNKYGGPLREKIARGFDLSFFLDMVDTDAFHSEVIAYPAITVIRKPLSSGEAVATRVARRPEVSGPSLSRLVGAMLNGGPKTDPRVEEVDTVGCGQDPWLLDDPAQLRLLRRMEADFPELEATGCKVGIGVATGCDRVFIGEFAALDVEHGRKLPLVMAPDLQDGVIRWGGRGIVNPFEATGELAPLEQYPRFGDFIEKNRAAIGRRHVAQKNPTNWYRTIDRIYPELTGTPKLLIPDIKGGATVVYDRGDYYPHHNLYYVTSATWDLRSLQAVLRSSIAVLFVSAYCVRMAGGFLRFQAQYLRRIRLPRWETVGLRLRDELAAAANATAQAEVDEPVFELFGLGEADREIVSSAAAAAMVRPAGAREGPQ